MRMCPPQVPPQVTAYRINIAVFIIGYQHQNFEQQIMSTVMLIPPQYARSLGLLSSFQQERTNGTNGSLP